MAEIASIEFILRKTDGTRNFILHQIKYNDLVSEKYKKTCNYLYCVENLLILSSTITSWVIVSTFASLACVCY